MTFLTATSISLAGCSDVQSGVLASRSDDVELLQGPPVSGVSSIFDEALICLEPNLPTDAKFSVGLLSDATGKEAYADGGTGKIVSQAAGEMVQSALFTAGVRVVNRRDVNVALSEVNWGIRDMADFEPTDFFISGTISSIDFIPGGGAEATIAGIGPRYRQNRILIAFDLSLTSSKTGEIVANTTLQKQMFAEELGFSVGRFFDKTLANAEVGKVEREALNHSLRQMLNYGTFVLLAQMTDQATLDACNDVVAEVVGPIEHRVRFMTQADIENYFITSVSETANLSVPTLSQTTDESPPQAKQLAATATAQAAKAIAAADDLVRLKDYDTAKEKLEAIRENATLASQALQAAAKAGLTGVEGEAAATLLGQALDVLEYGEKYVADLAPDGPETTSEDIQSPEPVLPNDRKLGGDGSQ